MAAASWSVIGSGENNSLGFTANFLSMMWKIAEPRYDAYREPLGRSEGERLGIDEPDAEGAGREQHLERPRPMRHFFCSSPPLEPCCC